MSVCDSCGEGPNRNPRTGAVVGCVSVYVGNDESYWFCSKQCYNQHWISEEVDGGQQRLHEVKNTDE